MNKAFLGALRGLSICPLTACRSPTLSSAYRNEATRHAYQRFFSIAKIECQYTPLRPSVPRDVEDGILVKSVNWAHLRSRRNFHAGPQCLSRIRGGLPSSQKHEKGSRIRSKDAHGLRCPFKDFSEAHLTKIFNHEVSLADGNKVLRTLHKRRVTGALIDLGVKIDDVTGIPHDALMSALTWLREKYPVDEEGASQHWVDAEAKRLEDSLIARAVKLGLYAKKEPSPQVGRRRSSARVEQPQAYSTTNTGISVLEQNKLYHEERRKKEAQERKESGQEQEEAKSRELAIVAEKEKAELRAKRKSDYVAYYRDKATIIKSEEVPEMPLWKRLAPSTLFAAVFLTCLYYFAQLYTPPAQSQRLFPNVPTAVATVITLIGMNCFIYCSWHFAPAWRFMNMFFLQIPAWPYTVSILGNVFSHQEILHLAANMTGLALYGVAVHEDIGRGNFLAVYLSSGVVASLSSLWYHVLKQRFRSYHMGASGAVWGVMLAWAVLTASKPAKPSDSWGYIKDIALYAAIVMQTLVHFQPGTSFTVDVASHVGGATAGFLGAWYLSTQATARRKRMMEDGGPLTEGATVTATAEEERRRREAESEERRKWDAERDKEKKMTLKASFVKR